MNLEKSYNKAKSNKANLAGKICLTILGIGAYLGILYLVNLLWNYVVPSFGLPVLGYGKFLGLFFLLNLIKIHFLTSKEANRDANRDQIIQLLNGLPKDGR